MHEQKPKTATIEKYITLHRENKIFFQKFITFFANIHVETILYTIHTSGKMSTLRAMSVKSVIAKTRGRFMSETQPRA